MRIMLKHNKLIRVLLIFFLCVATATAFAQQQPDFAELKNLVQAFKKDPRGPYQAIRWFCPDGSIIPGRERCSEPGGIQHALPKDRVTEIARDYGIHLGQILAGTQFETFLDSANQNSRLKQYQLEQYLQAVDDGWIFRRARYYRGAVQAEDEDAWGRNFLNWLLAKDETIAQQFYLIRQASQDIPHEARQERWVSIRALSKTIADSLPIFMDLRIKLHGQPDSGDLQRVKDFQANHKKISRKIAEMLSRLQKELELTYEPINLQTLNKYVALLPAQTAISTDLLKFIQTYQSPSNGTDHSDSLLSSKCRDTAKLLFDIRTALPTVPAEARLALIDISNELEGIFFRDLGYWQPQTVVQLLQKNYAMALAAAGCGLLEILEWQTIEPILQPSDSAAELSFEQFYAKAVYARRAVEWGTSMVRTVYEPVTALFTQFELLAAGFIDDQVRSSVLLPFGDTAWKLMQLAERQLSVSNQVMGIATQNQVRGLNPGFALGDLEVIAGSVEGVEFNSKKIYAILRAPADLKPVAGIATVSEGNLVSHVQLLARNLGVPNAAITEQNLKELLPFSGQTVFYAVSPRGTVTMKLASEMTAEERALVEVKKRSEDRIAVPTDKLMLQELNLITLNQLRASDSGKTCGPKAANLGELKYLFPDKVVEGFIIPFGVFRQHLDQAMPGTQTSYWQFLQETFTLATAQRDSGKSEEVIEAFTLKKLGELAQAIKTMPLLNNFQENLKLRFNEIFGVEIGKLPVFIRSDTNMEDLKDFTGAGLNLTVFNVLEEEKILQGIKDVWASPYSERSYRWRQKYLLNPENVYPSILILPTVNVEKSGVMITTDVQTANADEITIAFNRGAGGAVEGQKAESYLLRHDGKDWLLTPCRENKYTALPETGGTKKAFAHFNERLLSANELAQLRALAEEIKTKLKAEVESTGPWDIELGFKDGRIWLFQVRPFVENKKSASSTYLRSLDPQFPNDVRIALDAKLQARTE